MDQPQEVSLPKPEVKLAEAAVPLADMQRLIADAVAAALAAQRHQHTVPSAPPVPELAGRTRSDGVLIETPLGATLGYTEVGFNDGTVRRDYR